MEIGHLVFDCSEFRGLSESVVQFFSDSGILYAQLPRFLYQDTKKILLKFYRFSVMEAVYV